MSRDRTCTEIRDRARALAERARGLAALDAPLARHARARLLEADAEAIADLADELLREAAGLPSTLPAPATDATQDSPPRILLALGDGPEREAIDAVLAPDHDLETATDGHQALAAARLGLPDAVVLDLALPGLDGGALLEALREEVGTAEIPVLAITDAGDDRARVRLLDRGAADVLARPLSLAELRARIGRTLRLGRRQGHLHALARTDALTGLANLRAFRARLDDEVRRARRYGTPLSCVMVDMDHLKPVNDAFGHAAGDRAIAAVAEILRAELRATDLGARYGGDEFVLLLPHTAVGDGRVLADRLCRRLAATELAVGDRRIGLRCSFGVAGLAGPAGGDDGADLVRRADDALYAAKRAGRGRVELAPPGA